MKTSVSHTRIFLKSALGLGLMLSAGFAQDGAIARVGSEDIPAARVKGYLENLGATERAALEKNPALLNQAVRTLILQQILLKEALAAGWDKQAEVVAQLERLRQGAIAESYLETVAKAPDDYPGDAELQATYDARKAELVMPKQVQVAQIYIAAPKEDKEAAAKAKAKIEAIEQKVRQAGGDFAAIARAESDETESAARGGEVGWLQEASLQPEIRQQVSALKKGEAGKPVQLGDGWYLVKVLDVKEASTATLDEVREQLKRAMRAERARQNREAYLAKLQQQNPMAINELALANLLKPEKP
jgi:parvulin-like peptidyl-prolyl isomerase